MNLPGRDRLDNIYALSAGHGWEPLFVIWWPTAPSTHQSKLSSILIGIPVLIPGIREKRKLN